MEGFQLGKKLCRDCRRKKAKEAERRLMESWLCIFSDEIFCPFSKISKDERFCSVCLNCDNFARVEREMDEEDERLMDEIDDIRRNLEKYGYSRGDFFGSG